jgi:ornithine cyclodeaminase
VSRDFSHARKLADDLRGRFSFDIEPVDNVEEALKGADLIVTATTAREPVVQRQWLSPGAHINAIGTYSPDSREIDGATMAAAKVFVDRRESAFREAGDYLLAVKEGLIGPDSITAEIGEVLIGAREGRSASDQITLFKSLGLAIEDLACAERLFIKAQEKSEGTWVEF